MLRRLMAILAFATLVLLGGCATPAPTDAQQTNTKSELVARGFNNPRYTGPGNAGWSLYHVGLGSCRLVIGENRGSFAWLVKAGNNQYYDYWVDGDDRLNAGWLRAHPAGNAVAWGGEIITYDLGSCLAETP